MRVLQCRPRLRGKKRRRTGLARLVMDHIPSVAAYVDLDQRCQYVNSACEDLLGLTPSEVVGKKLADVLGSEAYRILGPHVEGALEGKASSYQNRLTMPGGNDICTCGVNVPHLDEKGRVQGFVTMIQDVSARVATEEAIRAELENQKNLLKETHHRVKNNMQVISSLLSLQMNRLDDPQAVRVLEDTWERIQAMAVIHERLFFSQDSGQVDLASYIQGLATYLSHAYQSPRRRIEMKVSVGSITLGMEEAVSCGLALNELITNCYKHAFVGNTDGIISVQAFANIGGGLEINVVDNGVGLPCGFDLESTDSWGLSIVKILVRDQLKGELELGPGPGPGTSFTMRMKRKVPPKLAGIAA